MDASAWYGFGRFATLDEAIEASCEVVTSWLEAGDEPGMTGEQLFKADVMFGDDPFSTDSFAPYGVIPTFNTPSL